MRDLGYPSIIPLWSGRDFPLYNHVMLIQPLFRRGFLALIVSGLLASACSEPEAPRGAAPDTAGDSQSLLIYTGRDKDEVAQVVDLFTQKYPQYKDKVETVILPAQQALTRLRAEQANPQAGFLWGGTIQALQQAASEQLLAPSSPDHANLINASHKDPEGRWFAEMLLPEVIV